MSKSELITLSDLAYRHIRKNEYSAAAEIFMKIVEAEPTWEHGTAAYSLACALEETGDFTRSRIYYELALNCNPIDEHFLEGFASFLFLNGDPMEAFEFIIELLRKNRFSQKHLEGRRYVLETLANKLGWSIKELNSRIEEEKAACERHDTT